MARRLAYLLNCLILVVMGVVGVVGGVWYYWITEGNLVGD